MMKWGVMEGWIGPNRAAAGLSGDDDAGGGCIDHRPVPPPIG